MSKPLIISFLVVIIISCFGGIVAVIFSQSPDKLISNEVLGNIAPKSKPYPAYILALREACKTKGFGFRVYDYPDEPTKHRWWAVAWAGKEWKPGAKDLGGEDYWAFIADTPEAAVKELLEGISMAPNRIAEYSQDPSKKQAIEDFRDRTEYTNKGGI